MGNTPYFSYRVAIPLGENLPHVQTLSMNNTICFSFTLRSGILIDFPVEVRPLSCSSFSADQTCTAQLRHAHLIKPQSDIHIPSLATRHTPHAPSIRSCSQFSVFPDDGNSHLIIHTAASLIPALQGSSMRSWHWRAIFNEMFMDCLLAMVFMKFGSPEKDIYYDAVLLGVPFGFGGHLSAVHLPMH